MRAPRHGRGRWWMAGERLSAAGRGIAWRGEPRLVESWARVPTGSGVDVEGCAGSGSRTRSRSPPALRAWLSAVAASSSNTQQATMPLRTSAAGQRLELPVVVASHGCRARRGRGIGRLGDQASALSRGSGSSGGPRRSRDAPTRGPGPRPATRRTVAWGRHGPRVGRPPGGWCRRGAGSWVARSWSGHSRSAQAPRPAAGCACQPRRPRVRLSAAQTSTTATAPRRHR